MRLLVASSSVPFPANNGINLRNAAILRALAELGHEVDFVALGRRDEAGDEELNRLCKHVSIIPFALKNLSASADYVCRVTSLPSRLPYGIMRYDVPAMREAVGKILERDDIDAVICSGIVTLVNLPNSRVPVLLDSADVEHLILKRYLSQERNPAKAGYAWLEYRKLRAWEQRAYGRVDSVLLCSEHDKSVAQQVSPSAQIHVVPNIVDTDFYTPARPVNGATLVYTGGMDWYPNRDAVEFFSFRILPKIQQCVPKAKFIVAGRNPAPEFLRKFADLPDIEFTGTVADMRPYIASATVCVIPLRIGSGTRLKILEAGAMAKAMVSTRLGAEGLDMTSGDEILLADDSDLFASAVTGLLADPGRRARLGEAARRRIESRYSFAVLKNSIEAALRPYHPQTSPNKREEYCA